MLRIHLDEIKDLPIGTPLLITKQGNKAFQFWCKKNDKGWVNFLYPKDVVTSKPDLEKESDIYCYVPSKDSKYFSDYDTEVKLNDSGDLLSFLSDAFSAAKDEEECLALYQMITELAKMAYQNRLDLISKKYN